ncbi:uncharacterized protein LOC135613882 [Musa acuminata AAA Group]|uniref:uncharacterized protein LOC135613882 n=1 Tax=Musa acuminata AAA Group TaxID=214697 RepID=UPI0031DEBE65
MEVYVDDMIVKSQDAGAHLADLAEAFATLRKYGMRLNPAKCAFGVTTGKFLGFIIHERGIDANPEKVQAIINMQSPQMIKDLQRLNGRLVAMSRFLARSVSPGEKLGIYLAASQHAVSFVLVKENSGEQLPVYYVSHVLNGPEERYPPIEKLALALVLSAQKLRPYFHAHPVEVITDQPLRQILSKFDVAGRLLKWAVELGEHDVQYAPRTAIKAQSMADFIAELTQIEDEGLEQPPEAWVLHVDGSANSKGIGAGLVLQAPDGRSFERSLRFEFQATNNEAEYEALLAGLRLALEMQVVAICVLTDSQLVAEQLNGGYEARDTTMAKYLAQVINLTAKFPHFTLFNVPRGENEHADMLAKLASKPALEVGPEVEELPARAIEIAAAISGGAPTSWVQELLCFKQDGTLPPDKAKARRLRRMHAWYTEVGRRLYKRSFSYPLLRCLEPDEAQKVLAEVHEGIYGEHFTGKRFREFCANHGIQLRFSSVAYPQTNGLAEVTNRSILDGLKRRVSAARSAGVLWSLRTTPKTATRESPYSLAFGTEAILSPEVAIATLRTGGYDEKVSNEGL